MKTSLVLLAAFLWTLPTHAQTSKPETLPTLDQAKQMLLTFYQALDLETRAANVQAAGLLRKPPVKTMLSKSPEQGQAQGQAQAKSEESAPTAEEQTKKAQGEAANLEHEKQVLTQIQEKLVKQIPQILGAMQVVANVVTDELSTLDGKTFEQATPLILQLRNDLITEAQSLSKRIREAKAATAAEVYDYTRLGMKVSFVKQNRRFVDQGDFDLDYEYELASYELGQKLNAGSSQSAPGGM